MDLLMQVFLFISIFAPLLSGLCTGLLVTSERLASKIGVGSMCFSAFSALFLVIYYSLFGQPQMIHGFSWINLPSFSCSMGFLVDGLSLVMLLMVSFVSLLVHVYSIRYMSDETGFVRFFSLISLFTFAMLFLVTTDNLVGLFFGWEGVSLFSYALIGFYYAKDSAASAGLKAFLINRFGDCAFCLALVLLIVQVGSPQYTDVFEVASQLSNRQLTLPGGVSMTVSTLAGFLMFVGAMTKSAQMPLHIWLPDSMEGPTPVSALIHAATMVTAGVYLLCRFSGLIQYSDVLLNFIAFIGASGCFWLGLLAIFENDIKRIIAYSTLSQLGYMMVAVGVGAFHLAIFHLILHALYKSLLFLAAGSVIIALDHQQDIRRMGGLYRCMPLTTFCFLVGACSLSGVPPFSGFYSKDLIMAAVAHQSIHLWFGGYIYGCVLFGFVVTPLYIFRLFWVAFCGDPRFESRTEVCELTPHITVPLLLLSFVSIVSGFSLLSFFAGDERLRFFQFELVASLPTSIMIYIDHVVLKGFYLHALMSPGFYLMLLGVICSWLFFGNAFRFTNRMMSVYRVVSYPFVNRYGFDFVNDRLIVPFFWSMSLLFNRLGEGYLINRTYEYRLAQSLVQLSSLFSRSQTSLLNRYLAVMGVSVFLMILIYFFHFDILRGLL